MVDDPRYIVLGVDGRYVTLGRAEIGDTEAATLFEKGVIGWIAIAANSFYRLGTPRIKLVKEIGSPGVSFSIAVQLAGGKLG